MPGWADQMSLEFRPNFKKIVELLLYLAHKKPGADKYQAVKFFYLADREHLLRYGRPITNENYFALKYGPVASAAKGLLEKNAWTMRDAGITALPFETVTVERPGPDKAPLILLDRPLREVDYDVFSKSDLRVFDRVLKDYGDKTFDELYELTHEHYAYKRAWNSRGRAMKRAKMFYEEMIEDSELRKKIVADFGPVSAHM